MGEKVLGIKKGVSQKNATFFPQKSPFSLLYKGLLWVLSLVTRPLNTAKVVFLGQNRIF